jgi:hypothetical protein
MTGHLKSSETASVQRKRLRAVAAGQLAYPAGFEVVYLDVDGGEIRRKIDEAVEVAFERVPPVRSFPSYQGQRNYPGFYWSSSSSRHVAYKSWLERDEAMVLDFDPIVVEFAAQPFWMFWPEDGRVRSHAPDFFARTTDGAGLVIDCRPAARVKARDELAFEATARMCAEVGWDYRLVHGYEAVWLANVQWLAGYRHPRHLIEPVATGLEEVFMEPFPLMEGAEGGGSDLRPAHTVPSAVVPTFRD